MVTIGRSASADAYDPAVYVVERQEDASPCERKAGDPMAERISPFSSVSTPSASDEIVAVIAAEEPHGVTPDQVARTLRLGFDGAVVQGELEELVARGVLDRRGLSHGAVYTLNAMA